MVSNQPLTRLHAQMDHSKISRESKIQGREPVRLNAEDARARGIAEGDVVKVFNDRGALLAGAVLVDKVRPGVIELSSAMCVARVGLACLLQALWHGWELPGA